MNDPSDGGGSDISHVVREFGIGEIGASAVVVVDPLGYYIICTTLSHLYS
jgi:hypothetical protein